MTSTSGVLWRHCVPLSLSHCPCLLYTNDRAGKAILKLVQGGAFPKEIEALQKIQQVDFETDRQFAKAMKSEVKKSSTFYRLDPFLDRDGLIRVGGRLSKSQEFSKGFKHPVILAKKILIVKFIVRDAHKKVAHAGRGITLNELRNQYWILNANSVVRHFISKCVVCRHLRGTTGEQKMADLSKGRITPFPPFTYTGVDYFGSFYIKEGRKDAKRYGALFTCLANRAVHIETADSLEMDSFINAQRRFIVRRGPVREIRSDQGTNIVGEETVLKKALAKLDQQRNRKESLQRLHSWLGHPMETESSCSVPYGWSLGAPDTVCQINFICTDAKTRSHLWRRDESFRTLLAGVECTTNDRPLTVPSSDPEDLDPLTLNHILTMKSKVVMPPPGNFQKADLYLRKRWETCAVSFECLLVEMEKRIRPTSTTESKM